MLAQPSMAAEGINGNLVSVTWLEKNLNHKEVLLLDASLGQIHAAKHTEQWDQGSKRQQQPRLQTAACAW